MPEKSINMQLTERQQSIFVAALDQYVRHAHAISSKHISQVLSESYSPATIRNEMAVLEDMGLLTQQHTSAGRIPTENGYGYFVDCLMKEKSLSEAEKQIITSELEAAINGGLAEVMKRLSVSLSRLSTLVSIVVSPHLADGKLQKIDLVRIASGRIMFVLSISGGLVKTVMLDFSTDLHNVNLEVVTQILNQRLCGLKLGEIRSSVKERLGGIGDPHTVLVRMVIDLADTIFYDENGVEVRIGETRHVFEQPEFSNIDKLRSVFEVLDDRPGMVSIFDGNYHKSRQGVHISIGEEIGLSSLSGFSVISAPYSIENSKGNIGIIGPTRMDYGRQSALISYAAKAMCRLLAG